MTSDIYSNETHITASRAWFDARKGFPLSLKYVGYFIMIVVYIFTFGLAFLTLGLIEIRQANLSDFNGLIATLDERDRYTDDYFDRILNSIASDRAAYERWMKSLTCSDLVGAAPASNKPSSGVPSTDPSGQSPPPQTCAEIKVMVNNHLNALSLLEEDVLFKKANLKKYYDSYRDGIRDKTPQLIPVLPLLDSGFGAVTLWARLPFELLEMLLLVCMGALGGLISVTRCFVDSAARNPTTRDLCYRPAAGAVIALGIYILFRASQLFFGGPNQSGGTTVTTSIFVLAALGLASGFCAREAVSQIERVATRLLRGSQGDQAGNMPAADPHDPPLLAAPAGGGAILASPTPTAG